MSSPDLQTVVIACPNCGTRYQVPYATIGTAGREVQCAQCSKPWHARAAEPAPMPEDDLIFSARHESALDAVFEAEAETVAPRRSLPPSLPMDPDHAKTLAEIKAAIAPRPKPAEVNAIDPALLTKSKRAFERRQERMTKRLPMAQVRRSARLAALLLLVAILALGFMLRVELVRTFPALAGLYSAIGLPVNVIGLEFEDSKTMTSLRDGKVVMLITTRIRSVSDREVAVPPVLVSLLDKAGSTIYEWTVAPQASEMGPREMQEFSTEVSAPPEGAVTVRLSFTSPRANGSAASLGAI